MSHQVDTAPMDQLLRYLWENNATDLHLCAGTPPRVRIDGKLFAIPGSEPLSIDFLDAVLTGLLSEEDADTYLAERQLDFAFTWADTARFRANAFFQLDRPALALRLIPQQIPTPEEIGLPEAAAALLTRPHGLVLMTGPTGSGKSTTLAAMIGWINRNRPLHIITIEDPVEYIHPPQYALVNQREVGQDCTSFAEALKAALREDPDVVLIGEMRDLETIQLALTLAETGHLVFGTLHTNDAAQTVDRVVDVFPADQQDQIRTQFSMALAAVISQRLIPRIGGGRVAAYEMLMATPAMSNVIREGKVRQIRNMIATGQKDGMMVMEQSLAKLVTRGIITHEDAMAASIYPDEIAGLAQHGQFDQDIPEPAHFVVGASAPGADVGVAG
ncbi:MAG: type IV pilus twitching motility protein PilT [Microthrixaceae bacterium]